MKGGGAGVEVGVWRRGTVEHVRKRIRTEEDVRRRRAKRKKNLM